MKVTSQMFGVFGAAALSVYSGPVKLGDAATPDDQPGNTKSTGSGAVSETNNQVTTSDAGLAGLDSHD